MNQQLLFSFACQFYLTNLLHLINKIVLSSMLNIDQTQSIDIKTPQRNEFIDEPFQYQKCPHCQRSFFMGKLIYHLKLCKPERPMFKTPLKSTRQSVHRKKLDQKEKDYYKTNDVNFGTFGKIEPKSAYQKCEACNAKLPGFMIQKHKEKCFKERQNHIDRKDEFSLHLQRETVNAQTMNATNKAFNSSFSARKSPQKVGLPTIHVRKSGKTSQKKPKLIDLTPSNVIRIRDDLRCLKVASQVQKVTCPFCDRRFSWQASQRHIPICQSLQNKDQKSIALRRKPRDKTFYKKRPSFHDRKKMRSLLQPSQKVESMAVSRLSKNQFLEIEI